MRGFFGQVGCVAVVVLATATFVSAALPDTPAPILCIGDSLTFGEGGNGVTYPGVVAARTGVPTVNLGFSGHIPRHIVYRILLQERPFVTAAQLRGIPPAEYERRKNQPGIDNLRTFLADGQTVWVREPDASAAVQYRWDATATRDDATTLKPDAVGDPAHQPAIPTGRWLRQAVPVGAPREAPHYAGVIFCIGANGMEADDVQRSLQTLLQLLAPPDGHFLVLGLMNRVDAAKHPEMVAQWAPLIAECNSRLRDSYPDHFLDLQAWIAAPTREGQAGYRTAEWLPYAPAARAEADAADQARGLVPGSLRAPGNTTHLNGTGYTVVGTLAADWIARHGWLERPVSVR